MQVFFDTYYWIFWGDLSKLQAVSSMALSLEQSPIFCDKKDWLQAIKVGPLFV